MFINYYYEKGCFIYSHLPSITYIVLVKACLGHLILNLPDVNT